MPSSRFRSVNPWPNGREPARRWASTKSRLVIGRRKGSGVTWRYGPGHERLGVLGEQLERPVVIEVLGQADGFLSPVIAAARPGVWVPTPWLSAS